MSTFVVRFPGHTGRAFKGIVRHVSSGEESTFASSQELIRFMTGMNAVHRWESPGPTEEPPADNIKPKAREENRKDIEAEDPDQ